MKARKALKNGAKSNFIREIIDDLDQIEKELVFAFTTSYQGSLCFSKMH